MVKSITAKFSRPALLLIFFALFFCLSGCGGSVDSSTGTGTGTTTTDLSSLTLSVPSSVTYGTPPVTVTAILRDTTGTLVNGAVVTFAASDTTLAVLTPTTALTDVNGTASVTLSATSNTSNGATYITASAQITTNGTTTTINSTPVGIAVHGTTYLSSLTLSVNSNIVAWGAVPPVKATATLMDADGHLLPNTLVTFTAGSGIIVFTPTATALTGDGTGGTSLGVASVTLNPAAIDSAGATSITASAPVTTNGTTTTITSTPVGIAVNAATVTLGALTLGQPSISAYGTSSLSIPVYLNGVLTTTPISVAFTSPCVTAGKATLTSPVTTILGTAASTYKDNGCGTASDLITATVTGATASATITVATPAANNIQFVSATPAIIGTKTVGAATLSKSSIVKFQVVDQNNNGVKGVLVDFSLVPANAPGGIVLSPTSATSDADGYVTTSVTSGTVPTPVWVVATINGSSPAITSQSNTLTITTGLPTQNFFSLAVQTHNIEGYEYDGVTSALTIIASDRLGEPVPDGTAINFITEGCQINPASCTTTNGTCTVTFRSSEYRPINETTLVNPNGAVAALDGITPITINHDTTIGPALFVKNGRVTILAYALGEESFVDSNGNNMWDSGETFYDLGDLFLDSNENGIWDSNTSQPNLLEQYISYPLATGTTACGTHIGGGAAVTDYPPDYVDVPSKQNTCDSVWGLNYVRRSQVIVLSSSHPKISQDTFHISSCLQTFSFWLMDENNNPMPAGTTVSTTNSSISFIPTGSTSPTLATVSVGGTPVADTTHAGGTVVSLRVDGGTSCTGAGPIPFPVGSVDIVITTPKLVTNMTVSVVNP